jgi:hypothetical protein
LLDGLVDVSAAGYRNWSPGGLVRVAELRPAPVDQWRLAGIRRERDRVSDRPGDLDSISGIRQIAATAEQHRVPGSDVAVRAIERVAQWPGSLE